MPFAPAIIAVHCYITHVHCILLRFLVTHFLQMGGFMSKQPTGLSAAEQRIQQIASVPYEQAVQLGQEAVTATQQVQKQSGTIQFLWLAVKVLAGALLIVFLWDWLAIRFGFTTLWWPSAPADDSSGGDSTKKKVKGDTSPSKKVTTKKPLLKSLYDNVTGGGGNLLSAIHDATTSVTIPTASVPLSGESNGSYSLQWWMYIQDWNYGFGKEKDVIVRSDPTNTSVVNPHVSLHPTENTLKVTVSVFADNEGVSTKAEPVPSGSGQTDLDVFTCEVANIPLQSWFSVGLTVFSRNLDIYIDGKLVKSCVLTGVPKPALGDVLLTPNGGYSGYMCGFSTLPRMLTPGDALNFFAEGTPCQSQTPSPGSGMSGLTGYSVKIGVYNPVGKEVQEYSF
jgi:hypothetical protein